MRIFMPFMSAGVWIGRRLLVKWRTPLSATPSMRMPVFLTMSSEKPLLPRRVVDAPGVLVVLVEEGDAEHADRLVDGGDGAVVRDGHLERAELQAFHRRLVLAELAGRVDLDLDRAVGRLLDVLLEGQRGDVLGLVVLGRLEVRVLQHLLRVGQRRGERRPRQRRG